MKRGRDLLFMVPLTILAVVMVYLMPQEAISNGLSG